MKYLSTLLLLWNSLQEKFFCAVFLETLNVCSQWHFCTCMLFLVILLKQNVHDTPTCCFVQASVRHSWPQSAVHFLCVTCFSFCQWMKSVQFSCFICKIFCQGSGNLYGKWNHKMTTKFSYVKHAPCVCHKLSLVAGLMVLPCLSGYDFGGYEHFCMLKISYWILWSL